MWLVGIVLLLLVTGSLWFLAGRRRDEARAEIWDIARTAQNYTTIMGMLAGFSVTSSIFIANLSVARDSAAFESVMALFLIAFLIFISAAMQFGTTPNLPGSPHEVYQVIQQYSYQLANASFYLGLSLAWLGLPLLLSAIGLRDLSAILLWLVLVALLGGAMRMCQAGLHLFARIDLGVSLAVPPVSFAVAAFYTLVLGRQFRELLPAQHGPIAFAVLCFVLAVVGFALQSNIAASLQREAVSAAIARVGSRFLLAYLSGVVTVSALLWLAVAAAI